MINASGQPEPTMSEHKARIEWNRSSEDFSYKNYNREHQWSFEGGTRVAATAATAYLGKPEFVDPEEAFVASLSACHMLTFLALCSMKNIVVNSYSDEAKGHLEKNEAGRLAITRVELRPVCKYAGEAPDRETLEDLHERSHEQCFIANSVRTKIDVFF